MFDDGDEDFSEDSQYQTHYCCNDCGQIGDISLLLL